MFYIYIPSTFREPADCRPSHKHTSTLHPHARPTCWVKESYASQPKDLVSSFVPTLLSDVCSR